MNNEQIIPATAMPPTAANWLVTSHVARVLHIFDSTCNLVNDQDEVLSLLPATYGRHPFALTLADVLHFPSYITAESAVRVGEDGLWVGKLQIQWQTAELWNPVPAWEAITPTQLTAALPILRRLLAGCEHITPPAGWEVGWLIGRGPGLTPAGDDFLMGWLYAGWAMGTPVEAENWPLTRTTTLSAAYLRAAIRGEAAESWHNLVRAVGDGAAEGVATSGRAILATGHTSGADALFGFVCGCKSNT